MQISRNRYYAEDSYDIQLLGDSFPVPERR